MPGRPSPRTSRRVRTSGRGGRAAGRRAASALIALGAVLLTVFGIALFAGGSSGAAPAVRPAVAYSAHGAMRGKPATTRVKHRPVAHRRHAGPPAIPAPRPVAVHIAHQGRGGGTVSVLGGPRCSGDCTIDVLQGRALTLTADAPAGTRFDGWTAPDSCRATATCDVQVRGETTVIARFSRVSPPPRRFTLTVRAVGTGTVDACDGARSCAHTYDAGTNVALTARAHEARATVRWTGARCRGDVCTVRMTRDRTVRMAVIRPPRVTLRWTGTPCPKDACALDPRKDTAAKGAFGPRRYTLDIRTYPGGSVQAGDVRCHGLAPCRHAYGYGTPLALVAVPDPGFAFAGWAGCPSPTGETCQLPVTSDRMVVANFVGPS